MSTVLNEITYQRLQDFRRRRSMLASSRGWCFVVTVLIVTLCIAVVADAVSTNGLLRWLASGLIYLATLATWFWCCWLPSRSAESLQSVAKRFEEVDPRLREQLLTAVEFADDSRSQPYDSVAFKDQLQSQVAQLIAPVDVRQLLPWRLVRRWFFTAVAATSMFVLLALVPQLHWMNRIARALLPTANLDRVAGVAIFIEQPQPNSRTIASGDLVGVIARIENQFSAKSIPEKVLLESRSAAGELLLVPMQEQPGQLSRSDSRFVQRSELPSGASNEPLSESSSDPRSEAHRRFHATISTDEAWIEYRVMAGDAATRWHRLTTQPRPEVVRFEIALTPPAYSRLPTMEREASDGNIRALIGTQVRFALTLNQPVSQAEIRWQSQPDAQPLRLELDSTDGRYVTSFTVDRSDSYRIHLRSAETGFSNEFSPSYTVDAITDQPPEVVWTRPATTKQIVASDQVVALAANMEDELPIASVKQLIRINRLGDWQSTTIEASSLKVSDSERPSAEASLMGELSATSAAWQLDLLKISTRVGDVVETKLVVEDLKGQATESELVEFLISETSITTEPTPAELLRQQLAAEFEAFDQRIKEHEAEIQELSKLAASAKDDQNNDQRSQPIAKLTEAAIKAAQVIQQDIPKLMELIQQAASQTEDSVGLQELEQAGQVLSMLKAKNLRELTAAAMQIIEPETPLTTKQRKELEKEIAQQVKRLEQTGQSLSAGFRAMVTHDVGRRISGQVLKLEDLFRNFVESSNEVSPQAAEQMRRQAVVLSRQLSELQQAMLDALPSVRQETKQRVRQSADAMSNLVAQMDNFNPLTPLEEMKKQAEQVSNSLAQMKSASWFDGGLHDAIMNSHRRFAELAGQPSDPLRRAISNLVKEKDNLPIEVSSATVDAALENLGDRRALLRSRQEGDREFASDLGSALRAVRAVSQNESLTKSDQQRELTETSKAIETLQAAHGVNEVSALLDDLLRGERWSLSTSDARVHHPVLFNSFAERLENAVKLMRQANMPNELVSEVDRVRWHEATSKAGQKLNSRRWENSPLVSAAAELNQVSELIAASKEGLEPLVRAAREKLASQAPSLGELANQAAEATRELQQQTASLADAAKRDELPEESKQLDQLQSQQRQAEEPIAMLRDALVDHADAQNLLEEKQLMTAREADAAISVVDSAKEDLEASMQFASTPTPQPSMPNAPTSDQPPNAQLPDAQSPNAETLRAASAKQSEAADKFEQLAKHFAQASQPAGEPTDASIQSESQASDANPLMQLAKELGENTESQQQFNEAAQLARLAAARPEEVLRQLEQKLSNSPPMQAEMSRIAQELAEQALNRLDRAANQQQRMQPVLEASDPRFQAQKSLLLQDLQSVRESTNQILGLLVSEAKWTAGAGKEDAAQKQLEATESQLRSALAATEKANTERTFDELRATAEALQQSLSAAQARLSESSQKLQAASSREVHQNDADLANRRREMQDRQRRIAQQDVRNMEQFERAQQQLLRQSENELKQATQREKSLDQHRANLEKEVGKRPENESLKQQLAEAQKNLAYGRVQKETLEQTKQRLSQRVEAAAQERSTAAAKPAVELNTANPSSQLSAELTRIAAERSEKLASRLAPWGNDAAKALQAEASAAQLLNIAQEERSVGQSIQDSSSDLSRAARHEERLKNQLAGNLLAEQAIATESLNANEIKASTQALESAIESSKRGDAKTGQANASSTESAESQIAAAGAAISDRAQQLRSMLNDLSQQAASSPSVAKGESANDANANSQLLDAKQLAQLLDEVDRQLSIGEKDNDAAGQESGSSRKQTPSTLAAAAEDISSQLSRNRTPTPQPNSDQAMATDSTKANVDPQGPVAVKVVDVNRIGAEWGKLRTRASEEMIESQRESMSPGYRQQIEAYFRSLAERGQTTESKK